MRCAHLFCFFIERFASYYNLWIAAMTSSHQQEITWLRVPSPNHPECSVKDPLPGSNYRKFPPMKNS